MQDHEEDTRLYDVVMNHEEQYSIWLTEKQMPKGWVRVGKTGPKPECLRYIEEVWTDMRPLSLRKHMDSLEATRVGPVDAPLEKPGSGVTDSNLAEAGAVEV